MYLVSHRLPSSRHDTLPKGSLGAKSFASHENRFKELPAAGASTLRTHL